MARWNLECNLAVYRLSYFSSSMLQGIRISVRAYRQFFSTACFGEATLAKASQLENSLHAFFMQHGTGQNLRDSIKALYCNVLLLPFLQWLNLRSSKLHPSGSCHRRVCVVFSATVFIICFKQSSVHTCSCRRFQS